MCGRQRRGSKQQSGWVGADEGEGGIGRSLRSSVVRSVTSPTPAPRNTYRDLWYRHSGTPGLTVTHNNTRQLRATLATLQQGSTEQRCNRTTEPQCSLTCTKETVQPRWTGGIHPGSCTPSAVVPRVTWPSACFSRQARPVSVVPIGAHRARHCARKAELANGTHLARG